MSINWVMLSSGPDPFTPLPSEARLWSSPPRTSMTLQSTNKFPGKEPFSVSSSNGSVYLTNRRVVYVPESKTPQLESFAAPLLNLHDTHVTAPFFGPNAWVAVVQPVLNGGIPPQHMAVELKLTFKDGGAYDFHSKFVQVRERLQQAVEVARTSQGESGGGSSSQGGVNMDTVHLDQLPAYEESSSGAVPQQTVEEQQPPPPIGSQNRTRTSQPPAEPPPGYEESQREGVASSLEQSVRAEEARR